MKRRIHMLPATALAAAMLAGPACNRDEPAPPSAATNTTTPAQPAGDTTDAGLTTSVQARYYDDDAVRGRNISVHAENGVVTLRGTVESEAARDRAVSLAREVQGVRDVRDELTVRTADAGLDAAQRGPVAPRETEGTAGRAEETAEPGWITTKIQAQYFVNPEVKPWNIDVTTDANGVVTLEGEVEQAADREEAVRIARATEGVTRVENRLRVKGESASAGGTAAPSTHPDVWLTAKVQSKYFLDDLVKLRNIDVTTQNAVVTLSGAVASEAERRRAVALARSTEGVRDVKDDLKVDPSAVVSSNDPATAVPLAPVPDLKRPDAWITTKVQSQYFLDPQIKGHEINVDTTRGVVSLKGTVANQELKEQAERIARETEGVTRVINQLTVGTAGKSDR